MHSWVDSYMCLDEGLNLQPWCIRTMLWSAKLPGQGRVPIFDEVLSLFLKKILFIYFEREGKEERKRGRETSMWEKHQLVACHTGPNPQPRYVPWSGIELETFALQVSNPLSHNGQSWSPFLSWGLCPSSCPSPTRSIKGNGHHSWKVLKDEKHPQMIKNPYPYF